MDSILVVCYSFTGVSRRAAELLCAHNGWPLGEIHDAAPREGATGILRCLLDSMLRRRPRIRYEGADPADFRCIVLVSPIWGWRLAGPMRSFVHDHRPALRRVAVVSTMGSGGASNAVTEVAHLLGHAPIRSTAFTAREVEDGTCTRRLFDFGDALQPPSTASQSAMAPAWTAHPAEPLPEQP